jgi:hypothetical protein
MSAWDDPDFIRDELEADPATPDTGEAGARYPDDAVVRVEDMGPVERAYAEAMHEDCTDGPSHPLSDHSPWSGGDLDGTEPWPSFMARLERHGVVLAATRREPPAGLAEAWREAEAAAIAARCWFIVTTVEGQPGIVTIEARRWIDPDPIEEPARIWRQPLEAALRALAAALTEGAGS